MLKMLKSKRVNYLTAQLRPSQRLFSTRSALSATPSFTSSPSPPRLPESDQKLYEDLQKSSTGAFSTPRSPPTINQSPASTTSSSEPRRTPPQINQSPHREASNAEAQRSEDANTSTVNAKVNAQGKGEELHPDVRRGAKPEFDGERNPKTGEVGGPKNEPLRWGDAGDWSYNGRVTDF